MTHINDLFGHGSRKVKYLKYQTFESAAVHVTNLYMGRLLNI